MIKVLIVEDESSSAQPLIGLVRRYAEERGEKLDITWQRSAVEMLESRTRYDVCLLDIDLPGINGMEAAQLLRSYNETISIIFVTNLAKYAVRGYEVDAVGFIVKPATYAAVRLNLDKALRDVRRGRGRTIVVPSEDDTYVISFDTLAFAEVRGHSLAYHLTDGRVLEVRSTLAQLEDDLAGAPTVKVSRSCIANMDLVSCVRGSEVVMATGEKLHIPRGRKPEIVSALAAYLGGKR